MGQDRERAFASHHQFEGDAGPLRVENEPNVDPASLLQRLSSLLKDRTTREALHDVKKDQAQLLIDYLHSILVEEVIEPASGLHKAILFLLYKICKATLLYPRCYVLKGISHGLHEAGGGFSDIYNGQFGDQQLCLKVVRVFQKSSTDTILEMYAKEAIIWGSLSHPNVVPFYGVYYWNEERRQVCLVSPWFSNGNLVEYLRQHPLTPRVTLIHDVSLGLEYLHDQGLVQGDIKGVNILVDDFGRACLADLGLSSIRTDQTLLHSMHATTVSALSFRWAAPELTGESARFTVASDMWAFGCVCYEVRAAARGFARCSPWISQILKGELPFSSIQSDMQIIFKLITGSVPGVLDSITDIDKNEDIREVIEGCWAREPVARPLSDQVVRKLGASLRSMEGEEEQSRQRARDFRDAMKAKDGPLDLAQIDQIFSCVSVLTPDCVSPPQRRHGEGEEEEKVADEGNPINPTPRSPIQRTSGMHAQAIAQGPAGIKQDGSQGSLSLSGTTGGSPPAPFSPDAPPSAPTPTPTVGPKEQEQEQAKNREDGGKPRRLTIAERKARLRGIKFSAAPELGGQPPALVLPSMKTSSAEPPDTGEGQDNEPFYEKTKQAPGRAESSKSSGDQSEDEEEERARRERISAKLAGMGGMRIGMLPMIKPHRPHVYRNGPQQSPPSLTTPTASLATKGSEKDGLGTSEDGVEVEIEKNEIQEAGHEKAKRDLEKGSPSARQNTPVPMLPPVATPVLRSPEALRLDADELMAVWGRVGVQIAEVATIMHDRSKKVLIGDGTYRGFVDAVLGVIPNAAKSNSKQIPYGYLVYLQNGAQVQRRASEIMPGDIVEIVDARFRGHKGLSTYQQHVGAGVEGGEGGGPVFGVICEFEPRKSKVRVFQANQYVGQQTVASSAYRLDDLKSGLVKVYRVLEAQ